MIEMGKKYQTRNGFPVRILCTDRDERNSGSCHFPVVGLVDHGGERELFCWTNTGSRKGYACDDAFDLVPVPTKHEGWTIMPNYELRDSERRSHGDAIVQLRGCNGPKECTIVHVTWED